MANQMKITDVPDDCLEHIFKKLELMDLLNVAHSSKSFKGALDLAYTSTYGGKKVILRNDKPSYKVDKCKIHIHDLLMSLKLLRCFGHKIRSLVCMNNPDVLLERYVNSFCADSLEKIEFSFAWDGAWENLRKPFTKIEAVRFNSYSDLKADVTDFNVWFPQMRRLEFIGTGAKNCSFIAKHFPNLEHVAIIEYYLVDYSFDSSNIVELLRLNPQIKSLELHDYFLVTAAFIQSISEHLQRIETLAVGFCEFFIHTDGVVHFQNVKHFTVEFWAEEEPEFQLAFDQIETLNVCAHKCQLNTAFLEFIRIHRSSLVKVVVSGDCGEDPFRATNKTEVAMAMDQLVDIDIRYTVLSVNEAITFLDTCTSLKEFRFKLKDAANNIDSLKQRAAMRGHGHGYEWRLSVEDDSRILLQR
ncbi:uncharacterized protein LOC129577423 [Sitodiplosis mosellana]|uniref:uncharacterized protein LOC129577423 n=1 Tax=Sitodiplosis mosellana TaxID=263140 RepID=UPI002443D005|nr:uncharacterized protein LOC129577423 [Sitodiplosis mosellana]